MIGLARGTRRIGGVFVDPRRTMRQVVDKPRVLSTAIALGVAVTFLGLGTLPRQMRALSHAFGPTGNTAADMQVSMMLDGLTRLLVVDRAVPSPTMLLAAVLLVLLAEPVLCLAPATRPALRGVALLGLAPLVIERLGELVLTYLSRPPAVPGHILQLPDRFATGPMLFWPAQGAPGWAQLLEPHLNLISLWCVGLWTVGLWILDGRDFARWHLGLPVAALTGGGLITWALTQPVVALVLTGP